MKSTLMTKRAKRFTSDYKRHQMQSPSGPTQPSVIDAVWGKIREGIGKLKKERVLVKPLSVLPTSSDIKEQQTYRSVCSWINKYLAQTFSDAQLKQFQESEGNLAQALIKPQAEEGPTPKTSKRIKSSLVRKRHQ